MCKMSRQPKVWKYSENLRDFINNDLKIRITHNEVLFVSKKEVFTFRVYTYTDREQFDDTYLYQIADSIFSEIINLRDNNNEVF